MKNPNWITDELILALDIYISHRNKIPSINDPSIIELSYLLNNFWKGQEALPTLRNPTGIYMKIMNFLRLDHEYTQKGKVGLTRGSKLDEVVWKEYAHNPSKLSIVAKSIRENMNRKQTEIFPEIEDIHCEAPEGRLLTYYHYRRERNPLLIKKKKEYFQKKYGKLECEVCSFNFETIYGERGKGFIECHHILPLSELTESTKTRLDQLTLLCSNCHRMIHAKKPWITIEELKKIIKERHN